MFAFFRCVAEAVMEKGVRGLAEMVPGGAFACDVAAAAWKKYKDRKNVAEIRAEVQELAQANFTEALRAAAEAVREAAPDAAPEDRLNLELYLSQVPGAVRASLKRPEDASGRSVPSAFALNSPEDVGKLLPGRPPRFKPNDPVPGLLGWGLVEPLGSGGFGEVWLARHRSMASLCGAVKFCHGQQARDLKHESGLIDRVMAAGRHPNIVPLTNVYLEGETPWLMYEYVPGGDLADVIREWQGLPPPERLTKATTALRELSAAVGFFHQLPTPVVHRDLKPSNVLFDRGGTRFRITDFGIGGVMAKAALAEEMRGGTTAGGRLASYLRGSHTPLYSSPQQRDGADPDPRDDVHALGVIGYQMLTGYLNQGAGPDFAEDLRDAGVPEDYIALLGRCVAQKVERRPATAMVLAEWKPAGPPPPPTAPPTPVQPAPMPPPPPTVAVAPAPRPPAPPAAPPLPPAPAPAPDTVTLVEVMLDPKAFEGKPVRVVGVYDGLYVSDSTLKMTQGDQDIWVDWSGIPREQKSVVLREKEADGRAMTVEGVLRGRGTGMPKLHATRVAVEGLEATLPTASTDGFVTLAEVMLDPGSLDGKTVRVRGTYAGVYPSDSSLKLEQNGLDIWVHWADIPKGQKGVVLREKEADGRAMTVEGVLRGRGKGMPKLHASNITIDGMEETAIQSSGDGTVTLVEVMLDPKAFEGKSVRVVGVYDGLYVSDSTLKMTQGDQDIWVDWSGIPREQKSVVLREKEADGRAMTVEGVLRGRGTGMPKLHATRVAVEGLEATLPTASTDGFVTLAEVMLDPGSLDGKTVRVRGTYAGVYPSDSSLKLEQNGLDIWVYWSDVPKEAKAAVLREKDADGRNTTVEGVLRGRGKGMPKLHASNIAIDGMTPPLAAPPPAPVPPPAVVVPPSAPVPVAAAPEVAPTPVRITFTCPSCEKKLRVADRFVGKNVACPDCGTRLRVPGTSGSSALLAPPAPVREEPTVPAPPAASLPTPPDLAAVVEDTLRPFPATLWLYLAPEIPHDKLANATASCAMETGDEALGLIDLTVFGSAKDCLLFGRKNFYYQQNGAQPNPGKIAYEEFPNCRFEKAWTMYISYAPDRYFNVSGSDRGKVLGLMLALQDALGKALAGSPKPVTPAPVRTEREFGEVVGEALKSFPVKKVWLYLAPEIPPEKLANATRMCGVVPGEEVLAVLDTTTFGSAKDCLVFGTRNFYYQKFGSQPNPGKIPYEEFADCRFEKAWTMYISYAPNRYFNVAGTDRAEVLTMLIAVQDAIKDAMG